MADKKSQGGTKALRAENSKLHAENSKLRAENAALKEALAHKQFRLEQLERLFSNSKSERFVPGQAPAEQLSLFGQAQEGEGDGAPGPAPAKETVTYERQKPSPKDHPGRTPIPGHFEVEIEIIEPEGSTEGLVKIGEERTEWVEYSPARLVKKVVVRPKYAKPQEDGGTEVLIGELPSRPLPKSMAGAGLLSHICVSKYVDHLPLYRQAARFKRDNGWPLPNSTLDSWFAATCTLLKPLYEKLGKQVLRADYVQADESRIKVLTNIPKDKEGNPKKPSKDKGSNQMLGWMWVAHAPILGLVLFNYEDNRGTDGAKATLGSFERGTLQVDGYASYNCITVKEGVDRLGCLAHVRRKFFEAKGSDLGRAEHALKIVQAVYAHESRSKGMPPDERKAYRLEHVLPIYEEFKAWLDEQGCYVTPKSPMGKAMDYAQKQWPNLLALFEDGRLLIDNNLIENKIRPLALGRKNYLFAGSHQGAQRAAMMYSFFATCAIKGVNPYEWLKDTLERIPETKLSELHTLLPGYAPQGEDL